MHLTPVPGLEAVPPVMRKLSVFYLFLLTIVFTALPLSTVSAARRALIQRLRDRTEAAHAARRRAEEAHAAKSRFLALMSHEMRTPLNSVTGYAEVLARRPALDDEALEQLDQIRASGDAMLRLVEDVLEISRGDDAVIAEPLSLETVITSGAAPGRLAAEARGLDFSIEVRPDAQGPVLGDPRRLRQAIHHLVGNAVKFTEAGWVRILVDRIDGEVLIAVSDSGVGLDPDRIDDLFQPFVQGDDSISRSHGGAGVGLTLVRRHAALMGGDVVARARPGEGSTFTLRLPLFETDRTPAADLARADAVPEALTPRALCVLVVDDHPANREVARLMLRAAGCETVEASDGDEAVALAAAQPFDLILMDVRMPRVDGLTATRAIRALPGPAARTPILAVTADAMSEDAARCLEAGMDAHLAKPISHQALYAAMDRVLSGPDAEADVGISEGAQAA
jgi:signal transduction histidine kinase/CheY-like chemotaxis protein